MKNRKIALLGVIVILLVTIFLFINNTSSKGELSEELSTISPQIQAENEKKSAEIQEFLYGESGIIKQVNAELVKRGYKFNVLGMVNSMDDVQLKYVLTNKDATETERETVKSIFFDVVKKNNLDANVFKLKVADRDDGPDW